MEDKDIVCLDVETTGLDRDELEILQLSMVRGDGQVLMNEYFKPERHEEWLRPWRSMVSLRKM